MTEFASADQLRDLTVLDREGEKVGTVGKVYRDDADGRPEWVTVKTGLFGSKETLVPLAGARVSGDELHVPVTKETVKHAPRVDVDGTLDADEESGLYAHYGLTQSTSAPVGVAGTAAESGRHHPCSGSAARYIMTSSVISAASKTEMNATASS
ncbi:PRC-barrel domain-containing protein, partial [Streptomyces sp. NPDC005534]|uniref:PRC-barrel domain-containing protein n=1 Tax=Streptomyces sp. NPDC005534 TaxID=3155714 RepID=UPI0034543AA4